MVIILEIPRLYIRDVNDKTIATLDRGDYFNDTLTRFLAGKASVLEFTILKKEGDYELFSAGKKISFKYEDEEFWLNMMITDQNEKELTVTALSLNMEFNNETVGPFSGKEWTFKQYFDNMLNMDYSLTLGINEVSDKKISNEWTGTSNLLARLFSLAAVFSAELEFVTELNPNGSLKRIVLNVYKEHSDTVQGLGADRRNETFRFGKDIKTVRKSEDASGVYTAIRPYGKDGLSIASIEKEIFDENGKLLFATYKEPRLGFNDPGKIYAPQSRDVFPSTVTGNTDKWTVKETDEMEYSTAEALFGYALGELKKNCVPKTEWEIEGYIKGRIGDTIRVADSGYKPEIYLDARITEQTISFTKPSQNKSTFSNVKELQSQVSADLLKEMEKIIEANKVYTCTISSTNGVTFKNGEGSTVLTAIVRDSAVEVTDKFSIEWFKDGIFLDTGAEITVKASDVDGKSVYKFVAKKADETVAGMYEVTVTDVSDGKDGNNGRGILGTPETVYGQSKLGTTMPITWSTTRPDVPAGEYLWTKTITKYTDNTESSVIIPTLMGPKGEQGTAGLGIKNKNVEYAKGTSGTVPPTSGWSTTIPTVNANEYFWTRTTLTYTNSTSTIAYSVGKIGANGSDAKLLYLTATAENIAFNADDTPKTTQAITISAKLQNTTGTATFKAIPYIGNTAQDEITLGGSGNNRTLSPSQWTNANWTLIAITATLDGLSDTLSVTKVKDGAQGIQGIPGKKGDNGKQLYTWLKYADSPTSGMSDSSTNKKYIGLAYNKETITMSTNYSDYSWSLVQGPQGVPGGKGDDGKQLYTWIKYATSDTGAGMSDDSKGKSYIGLAYNKETATESTNPNDYTWALIQGPKGDNGLPAYVHNAWANSPDGTVDFTTVYPGENILLGSQPEITMVGNGTDNQLPSNRYLYFSGDKSSLSSLGFKTGDKITFSAEYVISGSGFAGEFSFRLGQASWVIVSPGKARIKITKAGTFKIQETVDVTEAMLGNTYLDSRLDKVPATVSITVRNRKLEKGNNSTPIYTPSPQDDPIGAYPHYMGTCSNHSETAPTDPSEYEWARILGATGGEGKPGENGKEVISGYLSNESLVLPANASGVVSDFSKATGKFVVYEGQTQKTSGVTYAVTSQVGITTTIDASGTYKVTALSADLGTAIFKATYSGVSIEKILIATKAKQGPPTGITESTTVPTSPYVGMLWKHTGSVSGYIKNATYRWDGSKWSLYIFTAENISASTLSAITANLGTITAGVINGVTINGSEFNSNYKNLPINGGDGVTGSVATGTGQLDNSLSFVGTIDNSHTYETEYGPTRALSVATRKSDGKALSFYLSALGGLTIRDEIRGLSGTLDVEDLYDSGWIPLTVITGTGKIYCRKFMRRWMIRFENYSYDGLAHIATLEGIYNPGYTQMLAVPIWTGASDRQMEKFQLNSNGGLHKVSNVSQGNFFTTFVEIYAP